MTSPALTRQISQLQLSICQDSFVLAVSILAAISLYILAIIAHENHY